MTPTATDLTITGTIFALAIREFFAWMKVRNGKNKSTYDADLAEIRETLNNHMNDYNQRIAGIETDIKIIKNTLEDIKIAIKK